MNPLNWKLAAVGVLALALVGGGTALVAGGPEKQPVREPIKAPVPKAVPGEWNERDSITFKDGGRVTSVAFAPSGKTFAVCRDSGQIDFFDPTTRKHQQSMQLKNDPKANPNTEVGTVTALAFRPTPHAKLGDVFAVTHKNGVNFGTTTVGILADDAPAVEGVPPNWELKDADPRHVVWLTNDSLVVSNGKEVVWRVRDDRGWGRYEWTQAGEVGKALPIASLPGQSKAFVTRGEAEKDANELHFVARPLPSPQARLIGHKSRPIAAAVSVNGKRIVSADEGGTLIVWEGEKFEEKRRMELGEGIVQLALAADGKTVAVVRAFSDTDLLGTSGRTLFNLEQFVFDVTIPPKEPKSLWSAKNLLSDAKVFSGPASLAFAPDGKTLLAAFADPYYDAPKAAEEEGRVDKQPAKSLGVKVWELVPKK